MAALTFHGGMCTGEWEVGVVVIEGAVRTSCRMTDEARFAVVIIARYAIVLLVRLCLIVLVASYTAEGREITRSGMALRTFVPHTVVLPAVYGEELAIVVKVGRLPGGLSMARSTIVGKSR